MPPKPGSDVALLTGAADKPYALGITAALTAERIPVDLIGGDDLDVPAVRDATSVRFHNLRGDQRPNASLADKSLRLLSYYARLLGYAAKAEPPLFHILWNNKFQLFDRTLLMLYYRALGKKVVLTLHNVNAGKRDANDSRLNHLTLRIQYHLADHIFVHTQKMKADLLEEFAVPSSAVTVIPFGVNETVPNTALTRAEARRQLGIEPDEKTLLFFGHIAPYKGLEYLVQALPRLSNPADYRLIIVGRPKGYDEYWAGIRQSLENTGGARLLQRIEFVPDEETELYFKASDALVLPYRYIFQSGVLVLGYNFGLPVLAADVGSLREDVAEGRTGFVFKPEDPADLARTIERYFASDLYRNLAERCQDIRRYAQERHSWSLVAQLTRGVYASLLGRDVGAPPSVQTAATGANSGLRTTLS
jgi:glycosyltransferase involved in cell wall biosynthesis